MWNIGVGPIELGLLILSLFSLAIFRGQFRRWIVAALPLLAFSILLTPADPLSTLLVALPLMAIFVSGVFASSSIRQREDVAG